jgi:flagellar protein FliO/FliZ
MPPHPPATPGRPSLSFKLLAGVGFAVVCLGLFAPRMIGVGSNLVPDVGVSTPTEVAPLTQPVATGMPTGELSKLLGGATAVAVVWIGLTRYLSRRSKPVANTNLEMLASLAVDARCVVHLVRIGERRLLVGVDSAGVKAVTELSEAVPPPEPAVIGPQRVAAEVAALFARVK